MSGRAGVALLRRLERTSWLGAALDLLRLHWLVGAIYWVISKTRKYTGKLVRDAPGPHRFP